MMTLTDAVERVTSAFSKGNLLALYHVHFVDHADRVFDAIKIEHDTDEAAIEEAHRLDVPSIGAGFDVWHEWRLVHKHRR